LLGKGILRTYAEIGLLRSATKHLKFLPHVKNIMTLMWNCFRHSLKECFFQRIRQKSNSLSFSDREKPLDPSRKNNQGPLPANLDFFRTISSNLHFSTFKSPLGALWSSGVKKDDKFEWTEECQHGFSELKARLSTYPILVPPQL
jgi:hypothetical protein